MGNPLNVPQGSLSLEAIKDLLQESSTPPGGAAGDIQFNDGSGNFVNASALNSGDVANATAGSLALEFANGVNISGNAAETNSITIDGSTGISLEANDPSASAVDILGANITVMGSNSLSLIGKSNGITIDATQGGGSVSITSGTGITIGTTVDTIGFYGLVTPIAKPTVTGSKGANAALTNLLIALADLGLIVNNTT